MLSERDIVYFTPYHFPNGKADPKNKYFLVLKRTETDLILSVLPSSVDHFPNDIERNGGCHEYPDRGFSGYVINSDEAITECGKNFPLQTFLYGGAWLNTVELSTLQQTYPVENANYVKWGVMEQSKFDSIIHCFKSSGLTKNKHLRILNN